MVRNTFLLFAAGCLLFTACTVHYQTQLFEADDETAAQALYYAQEYASLVTEYAWGGQALLDANSIYIDCSGLVLNCYRYALANTDYGLPFADAAVIDFYDLWTEPCDQPRPGDIIFMGETLPPSHMSIFKEQTDGRIYFIDSTL